MTRDFETQLGSGARDAAAGAGDGGVGIRLSAAASALADSMLDQPLTVLRPGWPTPTDPDARLAMAARATGTNDSLPASASALMDGRVVQADLARVCELVDILRRLMFPGYFDPEPLPTTAADLRLHVAHLCARAGAHLHRQVRAVYRYADEAQPHRAVDERTLERLENDYARAIVGAFMDRLASVRQKLWLDVQAAYDGDPAAEHTDEIILCYPGMEAVFAQRVGHELYALGVPILPRVISELAHSRTGIDVHPGAQIGESFFIDHGSGTVIGETSVIGNHVKIYQGVTLGARSFPKDARGRVIRGAKRHPTIGNRVNIYAGAVILGGDTVIGDDCVIAGGVFVTSSVPPGHVVQQPRADLVLKPNAAAASSGSAPQASTTSHAAGAASTRPESQPLSSAVSRVSPGSPTHPQPDVGWLGDGAGI